MGDCPSASGGVKKALSACVASQRRLPVHKSHSRRFGRTLVASSRPSGEKAPHSHPSTSCAPGSPELSLRRLTSRPDATSHTTTSPPLCPVATTRPSGEKVMNPYETLLI